jgi:hypothetical protein
LVLRELVFIVIINEVALFTVITACITRLGPKSFWVATAPFDGGIPGYVARIALDRFRESVR